MIEATPGYFAGHWQIVRIIEDVPAGIIGEFWGQAEFVSDGAGLTCTETGVLRYRGHDYHSGRTLLWRWPEPDRIDVRYEDGRLFHEFLREQPLAIQVSGEDRFTVAYEFLDAEWLATWTVEGPARDYRMTTRYWRARTEATRRLR